MVTLPRVCPLSCLLLWPQLWRTSQPRPARTGFCDRQVASRCDLLFAGNASYSLGEGRVHDCIQVSEAIRLAFSINIELAP